MSDTQGKGQDEPTKIAVLLMLLEVFGVEQLEQLALKARLAKAMEQTDLCIRFKGGRPRWIKVDEWDEMVKP